MAIELVVFDMAGTTVHDPGAVNRCFVAALRAAGLDADPREVDAVMGLPKPEAIRLLVGHRPEVDAIHADFVARMLAYYRADPEVGEVAGAARLFADLKAAGIQVALDTGFSRDIADAILDRLGWVRDRLVDASITSDEVSQGRPYPDMIHHLMNKLGVADPAAVAKVGDAPADLAEGTAAGCGLVIGVTWGTHVREQLAGHPHTHLVDTMADLGALLLGRPDSRDIH